MTEHIATDRHILDVKEVCRLFRISREEVYRLVHSGRLPVVRLGRTGKIWRFYHADLLKLREGVTL